MDRQHRISVFYYFDSFDWNFILENLKCPCVAFNFTWFKFIALHDSAAFNPLQKINRDCDCGCFCFGLNKEQLCIKDIYFVVQSEFYLLRRSKLYGFLKLIVTVHRYSFNRETKPRIQRNQRRDLFKEKQSTNKNSTSYCNRDSWHNRFWNNLSGHLLLGFAIEITISSQLRWRSVEMTWCCMREMERFDDLAHLRMTEKEDWKWRKCRPLEK